MTHGSTPYTPRSDALYNLPPLYRQQYHIRWFAPYLLPFLSPHSHLFPRIIRTSLSMASRSHRCIMTHQPNHHTKQRHSHLMKLSLRISQPTITTYPLPHPLPFPALNRTPFYSMTITLVPVSFFPSLSFQHDCGLFALPVVSPLFRSLFGSRFLYLYHHAIMGRLFLQRFPFVAHSSLLELILRP